MIELELWMYTRVNTAENLVRYVPIVFKQRNIIIKKKKLPLKIKFIYFKVKNIQLYIFNL